MGPPQKRKKKGKLKKGPTIQPNTRSEADLVLAKGFIVDPAAGPATKAEVRELLRGLKLPQQIIDQVLKGFLGVKLSSDGWLQTFTQSDGGHYKFTGP